MLMLYFWLNKLYVHVTIDIANANRKIYHSFYALSLNYGLINYKDTKTKCRHLKNLRVQGLSGRR